MLKRFLFLVMFAYLLPMESMQAQQGISSFTIKAQATVVDQAELEVVTIQNLTIDESMARDGIIHVSAQHDPEAGVIMVLGKPEAHFRVQYIPERVIENTLGKGTLVIKYELYGFAKDLQYASEPIDTADRIMNVSDLGEYFFWVGGTIDISNASPGKYEGEFTIEIEYL
jgi:hypothetical protein